MSSPRGPCGAVYTPLCEYPLGPAELFRGAYLRERDFQKTQYKFFFLGVKTPKQGIQFAGFVFCGPCGG